MVEGLGDLYISHQGFEILYCQKYQLMLKKPGAQLRTEAVSWKIRVKLELKATNKDLWTGRSLLEKKYMMRLMMRFL